VRFVCGSLPLLHTTGTHQPRIKSFPTFPLLTGVGRGNVPREVQRHTPRCAVKSAARHVQPHMHPTSACKSSRMPTPGGFGAKTRVCRANHPGCSSSHTTRQRPSVVLRQMKEAAKPPSGFLHRAPLHKRVSPGASKRIITLAVSTFWGNCRSKLPDGNRRLGEVGLQRGLEHTPIRSLAYICSLTTHHAPPHA
jgi:hypothetical protein